MRDNGRRAFAGPRVSMRPQAAVACAPSSLDGRNGNHVPVHRAPDATGNAIHASQARGPKTIDRTGRSNSRAASTSAAAWHRHACAEAGDPRTDLRLGVSRPGAGRAGRHDAAPRGAHRAARQTHVGRCLPPAPLSYRRVRFARAACTRSSQTSAHLGKVSPKSTFSRKGSTWADGNAGPRSVSL